MNNATAITRTMAIRPGQRVILDSRRPPARITGTVVTVNGAETCGVRLDGSYGGAIVEVKVSRILSNFDPISQGQTMRDNYANNATRKAVSA